MSKTAKPHDRYIKRYLQQPQIAKDFLRQQLPPEILRKVDLNNLTVENTTFITEELEEFSSDIIFKTKIDDIVGYIFLLIEHQKDPDRLMPLRTLNYIIQLLMRHVDTHKPVLPLPIIYPITIYQGNKPYNYSRDFFDLFHPTQKWLANDIFYALGKFLDLPNTKDEDLKNYYASASLMFLFMKYVAQGDINKISPLINYMNSFASQYGQDITLGAIMYGIKAGDENKEQFLDNLRKGLAKKLGDEIMTIAERLEQKGMQQGMQQGADQKARAIALKLLRKHFDLQTISETTELSIEQILEIQAQQAKDNKEQSEH